MKDNLNILDELRRGNLILTSEKTGQKPYLRSIVKEIRENGVIVDGDLFCKCEDIDGIELTEDWFIKLGFEKSKTDDNCYIKNEICYYEIVSGGWIIDVGDRNFGDIFYYIHQLQNIHFALKGKKLNIK